MESHPGPSTRLLLPFFAPFPAAEGSCHSFPKKNWECGELGMLKALRLEEGKSGFRIICCHQLFPQAPQTGAGSGSREAPRCLELIPTSGGSFWRLGRREERRGNWKLKQSHKEKAQPDDFPPLKGGSNAANLHGEGADGAGHGELMGGEEEEEEERHSWQLKAPILG